VRFVNISFNRIFKISLFSETFILQESTIFQTNRKIGKSPNLHLFGTTFLDAFGHQVKFII
jgi:hypothetical protein